MGLGILFWFLAIICLLFGLWSVRQPAYAPYSWSIPFILILILGWQVFGPAIRGH